MIVTAVGLGAWTQHPLNTETPSVNSPTVINENKESVDQITGLPWDVQVTKVVSASHDTVYVGTERNGLYYNVAEGEFKPATSIPTVSEIKSITLASNDRVYVCVNPNPTVSVRYGNSLYTGVVGGGEFSRVYDFQSGNGLEVIAAPNDTVYVWNSSSLHYNAAGGKFKEDIVGKLRNYPILIPSSVALFSVDVTSYSLRWILDVTPDFPILMAIIYFYQLIFYSW